MSYYSEHRDELLKESKLRYKKLRSYLLDYQIHYNIIHYDKIKRYNKLYHQTHYIPKTTRKQSRVPTPNDYTKHRNKYKYVMKELKKKMNPEETEFILKIQERIHKSRLPIKQIPIIKPFEGIRVNAQGYFVLDFN